MGYWKQGAAPIKDAKTYLAKASERKTGATAKPAQVESTTKPTTVAEVLAASRSGMAESQALTSADRVLHVLPPPTPDEVRAQRLLTHGSWDRGEIEPIDILRAASAKQRRGAE